jgi:hypothetical protein
MTKQALPSRNQRKERTKQEDVIPDGRYQSVAPSGPAPEGTQITYVNGGTIRIYRFVAGAWHYWTLT